MLIPGVLYANGSLKESHILVQIAKLFIEIVYRIPLRLLFPTPAASVKETVTKKPKEEGPSGENTNSNSK
jgi:hypothetical protein